MQKLTLKEFTGYINLHLSRAEEVRIKVDHLAGNTIVTVTDVDQDKQTLAIVERTIIYPGYLNLTKPGTPSRAIALEDCGGFGRPDLRDVQGYRVCMSHTYNEHDGPWPEEGNEDYYLGGLL